ncbi:Uncharacterised protein [Halioglobus japonicus]|nr:Uncharacterised protein [Halioglobus japonicus]
MNPHSSAAIITNSYRTQAVRDLAWACFSPQMLHLEHLSDTPAGVSACTPPLTRERTQWLQRLDLDPSALLNHLSKRPTHRLGVYFEQLWHFFLQCDPAIELVAHNLAIHNEGRTLGEFDCIYYCADRACHVHLELAVKYFLGVPRAGDTTAAANTHEWLGPDQRDRLKTKLDQLLQRQIALGEAPAAKRKLQDMGIADMAREIALKGYLFQPLNEAPPPPPGFNQACPMSNWVTYRQLESHCASLGATRFAILPKMQWLSAALCDAHETQLTQAELLAQLPTRWDDDHYPLLIAALDEQHSESSRFFVTPGIWPEPAKR